MPTLPIRCEMVAVLALSGTGPETKLLLLRRAGEYLHGAWSYIAGHIEAGETGWQAARRELQEETGLIPTALCATSFCEQFYDAGHDCIAVVPAFVARVAADACVRLNGEHSAYRWLPVQDAIAEFPFGSQRDLIAHVRREFIEREPAGYLRMPDR